MDLQLHGKVALVTGSSRGLGYASARALAAEGAHVVLCARGAERLAEAAREISAEAAPGTQVVPITADVSTPDGIEAIVNGAVERFAGIDIVVNNVGLARGGAIDEATDAEWHEALDQTLFPTVRMSRLAVPHLRRRGGGVIVNIASIWGRESGGRMTYNAVKAAQISLGKSMAQQLAKDRIRVVSVAPGSILFPGGSWHTRQQADPEGMAAFVAREIPFGRFGSADEVGNVVAFLASPRASWISGTTVVVDGCQSRMF